MALRDQLERLVDEMVTTGIHFDEAQREFEKRFITHVLRKADGNLGEAAALVGVEPGFEAAKSVIAPGAAKEYCARVMR